MSTTTERQASGYADIGGHRTWFSDSGGSGEPLLVLHGGITDSDMILQPLEPALGARYRILAFDRRGHGRTADTDAAFHYDDMATETIAAIEKLIGGPAHLLGWSDGGNVALLVALRRPDLVRSLVLISANYHVDGNMPTGLPGSGPKTIEDRYAERSPDGREHFAVIFGKSRAMWAVEPTLTTEDLRRISAPALVMAGDDDVMTLAHTASLYESLPSGQLAVIPGTSHAVALEKPELVGRIIADFLAAPEKPKTRMPVRRRAGN